MPRLLDQTDYITGKVGTFQFSGIRPDKLGQTEYTLVTIVTDKTGSVSPFAIQLLECVKASVEACRKSPRVNNLLLRHVTFNTAPYEEHGFTPIAQLDTSLYQVPVCGGGTALFDACFDSIKATNDYAKILNDKDFNVNAIVFVITDGDDNASKMTKRDVSNAIVEGTKNEYMESFISVLIGINTQYCGTLLDAFHKEVGFTQYIDAGNVTDKTLAKLADFVSRSISSQSQSFGNSNANTPALIF